jgi:hypothetical protein
LTRSRRLPDRHKNIRRGPFTLPLRSDSLKTLRYPTSGQPLRMEPWVIPDIDSFDLDAAILRRSEQDLKAFFGALAARLEQAIPGRVTVVRKRDGLFSGSSHVVRVELATDDAAFAIAIDRGAVQATRSKVVRGVVLSTSAIPAGEWLNAVRAAVARLSGAADDAAGTIGRFV